MKRLQWIAIRANFRIFAERGHILTAVLKCEEIIILIIGVFMCIHTYNKHDFNVICIYVIRPYNNITGEKILKSTM